MEEGGEKPLNALVRGTTDLDPLGKKEASSSKAMPLNASVRDYNTCHYYYCYLILHSYMLFFLTLHMFCEMEEQPCSLAYVLFLLVQIGVYGLKSFGFTNSWSPS